MAEFFVDPTSGSNANGGTSFSDAWETLTYANSNSSADDIINIKDGTYTWSTVLDFAAARTFRGETKHGVIFDNAGATISSSIGVGASNVTIENIKFINAENATTVDNVFDINSTTGLCTFNDCWFEDIGIVSTNDARGAMFAPSTITLDQNLTMNRCTFVDIYNKSGATDSMIFSSRTDSSNGTLDLKLFDNAFVWRSSMTTTAIEAIFNALRSTAAKWQLATRNNIFQNDSGDTIQYFIQNDVDATVDGDYNNWVNITNSPSETNSISSDSLFVSVANDNYSPRPDSPLVKFGTNTLPS